LEFGYDDGGAWLKNKAGEGEVIVRVKDKPLEPFDPRPPVAVLIGPMTGSSGEAIVLAFRGRAPVRFFGAPTAGVSSSNKGFALSDGSELVITTGITVDRAGDGDGGKLLPDEIVGPQESPATVEAIGCTAADPVVAAAIRWLSAADASSSAP
jgi:C-terminal processing protease CtpA/Prc